MKKLLAVLLACFALSAYAQNADYDGGRDRYEERYEQPSPHTADDPYGRKAYYQRQWERREHQRQAYERKQAEREWKARHHYYYVPDR